MKIQLIILLYLFLFLDNFVKSHLNYTSITAFFKFKIGEESFFLVTGNNLGAYKESIKSISLIEVGECKKLLWMNYTSLYCGIINAGNTKYIHNVFIKTFSGHSWNISREENKPQIYSVSPNSGMINGFTLITIKGHDLGSYKHEIFDVGIVINEEEIPLSDESSQMTVPHLSCLWTAISIDSSTVQCKLSALHGGYRWENNTINPSARFRAKGGFLYLKTKYGGLGFNRSVYFSFIPNCHMHADHEKCLNANCYWCQYITKCVAMSENCPENCSSRHLQMTCSERNAIIITTFIVASLIVFLIIFSFKRMKILKDDISFKIALNRQSIENVLQLLT